MKMRTKRYFIAECNSRGEAIASSIYEVPELGEHLKEAVNYILEFEHEDYKDWVEREGNTKGHVYYHAKELSEFLED
jgi:hypothetical protein